MGSFYVPEIGDELVLSAPWVFSLFPEYRNTALATMLGYYSCPGRKIGWVSVEDVPMIRDEDYVLNYPPTSDFPNPTLGRHYNSYDYDAYTKACDKVRSENKEYVRYQNELVEWRKKCELHCRETIIVELPVGSVLKIDRIYIRKGAKDYSSITFYLKGNNPVLVKSRWSDKKSMKKSIRFWAKLNECNRIQFD